MRGESVLSMVFTKVFVCIYADLPEVTGHVLSICVFNVLSMQKIKGDVLSICFSDVLSAYLEHF